MNSDSQSNPASQIKSPRKPVVNLVVFFVLSLVVAIAGYSIYVAVHEPDPQETIIFGQTKLAAGSPAGIRIVVRNRVSGMPVRGAKVEVALQGKANGTIRLGTYQTDADGSFGESINIPEIPPGEYQLIVDAASSLGSDHVAKKIEVQNPARVLLSCDKPIYQPGQTIHLRSLALNGRTEKPLANEAVTFEVSDPKGNKVFKETRKTSSFGIASTDFVLATELNLGRYEIRALTAAAMVERTVEIKHYALPKFKIQITTDKSYYLPGETISGSVAADYFFGKPVDGGTVKLTAATFQEKPVVISDLNGRTDGAGKYSFHFVLPDFFTGMPQMNEQAFLDLNAEVRDTAGHQEEKTLSLSVAQNALEVAVIPEAGVFVPGVENIVYVFTSYPDGRPANCNVLVNGVAHPGNAQGLCEIKIMPADINQTLDIQAVDLAGKKRTLTYHSDTNHVPPAFLLRSDKAVYEAGHTAHGSGINREITANDPSLGRYVKTVGSLHNVLAVLTLLPMICYPAGIFLFGESSDNPGWFLLGVETIVVLFALSWQYLQLLNAPSDNLKSDVLRLRTFLMAFLMQFILSRGAVICMAQERDPEAFIGLWLLVSIIAPLVVLGSLGSHTRRQLAEKGITAKVGRATFIEVLIVLSFLCILAAMLLPALAKSKARAMSVQLMNDLKQIDLASQVAASDNTPATVGSATPRVRRDFPETLVWRPELITDEHGKASLEIPLADSITTWRASIDGVSAAGKMGNLETPITVLQDFFVDLDLPESLSLGDQVSVPVTCYNYLKEPQDVRFRLATGNWFKCPLEQLSVRLQPNEVKSVSFPIEVLRVGNHSLQVTAQGTKTADAIEREVRVVPTGERIEHMKNDVLKSVFSDTFTIPQQTIPDSQSLWLKFYPSRFSEVVEGLDSVFKAPYGCFEQTSSTTYPNVLVLDYMKQTGRLTPEVEIKARKYINAGYQRLLTFEVAGGGFEWFGRPPANICLTAYGVLEFTDMARVHPVDEAVTERARKWLFGQQNSDGSWSEIHRGWTWEGRGSMTAFVAWALAESGENSVNLDKALNYLRSHTEELSNTYAKALAANAFLARDRNDSFGRKLAAELKESAIADGREMIHWTSTGYSITYSHDSGMDSECTALCAMALMKAGTSPQSVKQALTWISTHKFADGTLGSTQATILAMRVLLQASRASLGQEFESSVTVLLNGEKIQTFQINKENSDVMKQIDLTKHLHAGDNRLELRQSPAGELPVQLAGVCWLPARSSATNTAPRQTDLLQIDLQYDRTTLAVNDLLKCSVTVKNNTAQMINMAIVDLGIPPGFDVETTAFESMQQEGRLAKFEATGNQVILYLRELSNTTPLQFNYTLRAKYPLRVQTPPSAVYEYYQPQNRAESKPVVLQTVGN